MEMATGCAAKVALTITGILNRAWCLFHLTAVMRQASSAFREMVSRSECAFKTVADLSWEEEAANAV